MDCVIKCMFLQSSKRNKMHDVREMKKIILQLFFQHISLYNAYEYESIGIPVNIISANIICAE